MRLMTMAAILALVTLPAVAGDGQLERIVARHVGSIVPPDGAGGVAAALRIEGRTLFFNYGLADRAGNRAITTDTLFNLASLRKVFETTLLAQAVLSGELGLDDPAAKYVFELQRGGDIRQITLRQLATHTSGLLLPQDHPPWPNWGYTLPEFICTLNAWTIGQCSRPAPCLYPCGLYSAATRARAPLRYANGRVARTARASAARYDLDDAAAGR